jgi:hypothetical protein
MLLYLPSTRPRYWLKKASGLAVQVCDTATEGVIVSVIDTVTVIVIAAVAVTEVAAAGLTEPLHGSIAVG